MSYWGYYYILQCRIGQGTFTNFQSSADGKFANVVNDSGVFHVNVLIGHLRIIFRHHQRKKKKNNLEMKLNELSIVPTSEVNVTPDYLHQSHAPLYDTADIFL